VVANDRSLLSGYLPDAISFPKQHKRLPTVLSQDEVSLLIDSTGNRMEHAMACQRPYSE